MGKLGVGGIVVASRKSTQASVCWRVGLRMVMLRYRELLVVMLWYAFG